ncbi:MAG: hypothetical protein CFE21_11685 [Bacteroidetes bacterium B1(2017)]|nr:MAG: hypothetical protein CFE21_11685 [Bacteroidetes bacterium B1(2017)]
MRPLLSKTTYLYGMQCHKRFYLNRYHKNLANPEEEQAQAIFQTGTDVGLLAQHLFPGGINAQGEDKWHGEASVKRTQEYLKTHSIIYEAAFLFNGVICAVDILVRNGNAFYAYEVKSTNSVKEQHIEDAALQYYVLSNCGLNLQDFSILHFNKEYVRVGEIDIAQLFTASSVMAVVEAKQAFIPKNIADFKKLMYLKNIPIVEMGPQCNKPYACNFSDYCSSLIASQYNSAIEEVETRIENRETRINRKEWESFTAGFEYPLFFFDFETIMYAVPEFNFSRPYQQIPFQYSLHILLQPHAKLLHTSYLGNGVADPRPDLLEQMIRELGTSGSIITWNMSFEKGILAKLAIDFPEYQEELLAIHNRIVDLMTPFRPSQAIVQSAAFNGSYSIKNILPVLVPELSYTSLNIQEGGTASFRYGQMGAMGEEEREQTRADLLEYCCLDTLAMVRIWEAIEKGMV